MIKKIILSLLMTAVAAIMASAQQSTNQLFDMFSDAINAASAAENNMNREQTADDMFFEITNNTGYRVKNVFVSKTGEQGWGKDFLSGRILLAGESFVINLVDYDAAKPQYNIRLIDVDGDSYTRLSQRIRKGNKVRIEASHLD